METIQRIIIVDVPVRMAYNQWTQFETFPQFMEGIEKVEQIDDKRLHWVAQVGGKQKEWTARITEQIPDTKIAWIRESGAYNAGSVTFEALDADTTQITVEFQYNPMGVTETLGDMFGMVATQVEGDLARFKQFIESCQHETGSWRATIEPAEEA